MFSALKTGQSSNIGAPYLWTAFTVGLFGQVFVRGGEAGSQRPLLPTRTVIMHSRCLKMATASVKKLWNLRRNLSSSFLSNSPTTRQTIAERRHVNCLCVLVACDE